MESLIACRTASRAKPDRHKAIKHDHRSDNQDRPIGRWLPVMLMETVGRGSCGVPARRRQRAFLVVALTFVLLCRVFRHGDSFSGFFLGGITGESARDERQKWERHGFRTPFCDSAWVTEFGLKSTTSERALTRTMYSWQAQRRSRIGCRFSRPWGQNGLLHSSTRMPQGCRAVAGANGREAGLDRSFLSMVERGIQSPNIVVLFRIAEVLGVPASELIARTEAGAQVPPPQN